MVSVHGLRFIGGAGIGGIISFPISFAVKIDVNSVSYEKMKNPMMNYSLLKNFIQKLTLLVPGLGFSLLLSSCTGPVVLLLFSISLSSKSEFSSVQYLHRIFASSPTFTDLVIMHSEINDTINNDTGTESAITNSRLVLPKSKRANTINGSFCEQPEIKKLFLTRLFNGSFS